MMLIVAAAIALLGTPGLQNEEEAPGPRIASSTPSRSSSARAPTLPDGPTRVVCEREKALDSNIMRRVCRQVPVNSSERERMAGDHLRQLQSIGLNSENGPRMRQPGGRPVN